jgi:ATP-binding cassette subfamily F protein 3
LVGPNGAGKTTLLEQIVNARGVRVGHGVEIAYFSQQEAELPTRGSVLEAAQSGTGLQRPQAQALLGRFLFSGWDEHEKPVAALSGGERRRLALAIVVASGANFLVLDEPTNHLDLESREALEAALEAFPGTVLLVTHDRALLDAVAERILAVEDGTIRPHEGGWADYVRVRDSAGEKAAGTEPKPVRKAKPEKPKPRRPSELELLEQDVEAAEQRIAELEAKLADDWTNVDTLAAHRAARDELQSLLAKWEQVFEAQAR